MRKNARTIYANNQETNKLRLTWIQRAGQENKVRHYKSANLPNGTVLCWEGVHTCLILVAMIWSHAVACRQWRHWILKIWESNKINKHQLAQAKAWRSRGVSRFFFSAPSYRLNDAECISAPQLDACCHAAKCYSSACFCAHLSLIGQTKHDMFFVCSSSVIPEW